MSTKPAQSNTNKAHAIQDDKHIQEERHAHEESSKETTRQTNNVFSDVHTCEVRNGVCTTFREEFKYRNRRSIELKIDADADVEVDSVAGHVMLRGQ
jgi:hypothetical protein